jgi:hypothetical protein
MSNLTQLIKFKDVLKNNPIPIIDLKMPGFEMHMRKDKFLNNLRFIDSGMNYSGPNGVEDLLNDMLYGFIGPTYALNGILSLTFIYT